MMAFPHMLISAAEKAGMKIPNDTDDFDPAKFPHFSVFCNTQLERPLTSWSEHWSNAESIAKIPDDQIMKVTLSDLVHKYGFVTTVEV